MPHHSDTAQSSDDDLALLTVLSERFPTVDAVIAEIARLSAHLARPKPTTHVLSDLHGEHAKLRHILMNASGTLRRRVERMFEGRLSADDLRQVLTLIYYPREALEELAPALHELERRREYCRFQARSLLEIVRELSRPYGTDHIEELMPVEYRSLLRDLLSDPNLLDQILEALDRRDRVSYFLRVLVRLVRNLALDDLVVAGDCWDRGPRGDEVLDLLQRQPNVSFAWGNHDISWLGACLGHEALIANVLRTSLRYRRLSQLEEGYGITLQPLEHLVRTVYPDDPAEAFLPKGTGLREAVMIARMHKAISMIQFKLEGQLLARHPEFDMDSRRLLHRMDPAAGTVILNGSVYRLKDRHFPSIDPREPYVLSIEEQRCMDRIRESFLKSRKLWEQIRFLVDHGAMYVRRDNHLIFHACVPADAAGTFQGFIIDDRLHSGRGLFDAFGRVVARAVAQRAPGDLDLIWYLWCGPRSPLFGKENMATFERLLIDDARAHEERRSPYYTLVHEKDFCRRVLVEFGIDPELGLIVNGHVPVNIEKGESPLKRSGQAIGIDGAFAEVYGDHGYTLILDSAETLLAQHHHFESVRAAVQEGADIIPELSVVRRWDPPRRVADTEMGDHIRSQITSLERLIKAYEDGELRPQHR